SPAREADVRAIIARSAIPVRAVVEVAAVFAVTDLITEAISSPIKGARRSVVKAWHRNQRRVEICGWIVKAMTRRRAQNLKIKGGLFVDLKTSIDARELVVLLNKVIARRQETDTRLFADIMLEPNDSDVSILVEET